METDLFTDILNQLSRELSIPLKPDGNHSCLLLIREKLEVQLELDPSLSFLITGCVLAPLPPGKTREEILFAALKSNRSEPPRYGHFGYAKKNDSLILFEMTPVESLRTENFSLFLSAFIRKAFSWKEAIESGRPFPDPISFENIMGNDLFG